MIIEPPKERPRLKLQPRQTEKTEGGDEHESSTKSSIFGSAKPVDTAKKEAEIDQKLQVRALPKFQICCSIIFFSKEMILENKV